MSSALAVIIAAAVALAAGVALALLRTRASLRKLAFAQRRESELVKPYLDAQDLTVTLSDASLGYITDGIVLVLGAGGSVGGQLATELAQLPCQQLILMDSDENGLYRLQRRLETTVPASQPKIHIELGSVTDPATLRVLCARYGPTAIFHYANYKSAALSIACPAAFTQVNLGGMLNILDAIDHAPTVERFIYISSDKAQGPAQPYGQTKRISEMLVSAYLCERPELLATSLRYCNVLDAAGSFAIPTFRNRILAQQPIPIRRLLDGSIPSRYFISVVTAAQLALVAGSLAKHGNIWSLDARRIRPVRADELARLLGRAYGKRNITRWLRQKIEYIPAEAGEKQYEDLGVGLPISSAPLVELPAQPVLEPAAFMSSAQRLVREANLSESDLFQRMADLINAHTAPRSSASRES